ncbi:hydrolase 1, exosortase A system-associated [Rhodovibrio salinarum]|uniref:hydrolase 1, exosortase A system-associated n=1 Tax=Rhodovibrio salinarum TaxID=1087 RepID=UPI00068456D3|nr:hydrolase 1, exosortase A system-associated [Rhodovibrio salinarum]
MSARHQSATTTAREVALTFDCVGSEAVAILHRPAVPAPVGVAIVVGGPQYRVGGHRQFVDLARDLAAAGIAVFRFDYRGIGDNAANHPGFPNIAPDIEAGLAAFRAAMPEVTCIALWALCDAVPAAAGIAARTPDVVGIAAVNPWIREPETHDRALLRHYYLKRPLQRDFWTNLLRGRTHTRDFSRLAQRALARAASRVTRRNRSDETSTPTDESLAARVVTDLARVRGNVLVLLSEQDLTAREFDDAVQPMPGWQRLMETSRLQRVHLADADHTCAGWRAHRASADATVAWLHGLPEMASAQSASPTHARPTNTPHAKVLGR